MIKKYSYKSRLDLGEIYTKEVLGKDPLLLEINEYLVDYLNGRADEKLPFEHIFGDKLRIVIPFGSQDPTMKEILDALKTLKNYSGFDAEKGEVYRKITLDPKYGGGEKIQKLKVGTVLSKLKLSDEDRKKYLNWLALYKDKKDPATGKRELRPDRDLKGLAACLGQAAAITSQMKGGDPTGIQQITTINNYDNLSKEELRELVKLTAKIEGTEEGPGKT